MRVAEKCLLQVSLGGRLMEMIQNWRPRNEVREFSTTTDMQLKWRVCSLYFAVRAFPFAVLYRLFLLKIGNIEHT